MDPSHPVGFGRLLLSREFAVTLAACKLLLAGCVLFNLFQHGIFIDLGVDHLLQLKLVQREHADHLHQAGGQYLAL